MKGYQLIEPDVFLSELVTTEISDDVIITIMSWLIHLLKNDNQLKIIPIEIDIVSANYYGRYPCIGIHYLDESIPDIGDVIVQKLKDYYGNTPFSSFYDYVANNSHIITENIDIFLHTE
jgi:predicted RNA methylase